jgi:hypothetical protein
LFNWINIVSYLIFSALKSTLGSDEVAEVFLAKLRQSLKRDAENESKAAE